MKILWIADYGIHHNIGGAQRTNHFIIEEGLSQGLDIQTFYFDSDPKILNGHYDCVVSNNLEAISQRRPEVFNYIVNHPYHVRYEHDSNSYLTKDARELLFGSAKISIFLSKFHRDTFIKEYGDIFTFPDVVTSPIDTSIFYDRKEEREDKILNAGLMHTLKGTGKFFEYVLMNPEKQFVMASWGDAKWENTAKSFRNVEWLGKVDFNEMPNLYNKYTTMYYKPLKFEPFCRAVGEALLCGMNVEGSDNIGALHDYNEYGLEGLKQMCNDAPKLFWNKTAGALQRGMTFSISP